MPEQYEDWIRQAVHDLKHAQDALEHEAFEWSCFAASNYLAVFSFQRRGRKLDFLKKCDLENSKLEGANSAKMGFLATSPVAHLCLTRTFPLRRLA